MSEMDVLVPQGVKIKVADREYEVGRMSWKRSVKFVRLLISSAVSLKKTQVINTKSNASDLIFLIDALNNDDATAEMFGLFLQENDFEFIKKNLLGDGPLCADILTAITEHNDMNKMISSFLKAMGLASTETETSSPSLQKSPTGSQDME